MIKNLLITPHDIAVLKEFDLSTFPAKINPHILSAQREDVLPLIKENLYNAIIKNPEAHAELLNEGYYMHEGKEYMNYGLKAIIALFANARFTLLGSATPTPYGHTQKKSDSSEPLSKADKEVHYNLNRSEALDYWGNVYLYLIRTKYPLFEENCRVSDEQTSGSFSFGIITRH